MSKSKLDEMAGEYVSAPKGYEYLSVSEWERRAFLAGARAMLPLLEDFLKAQPETSFHPNHTAWQAYDYLKKLVGEK